MKAILFDFDGTLVDSLLPGLEGVNELAEQFRFEPLTDIPYLRQRGLKQVIRHDLGLKWYQFPFFLSALKKLLIPRMEVLDLHPGWAPVIREAAEKKELYILTSNVREAVQHVLDKNQLDQFREVFPSSSLFGKDRVFRKFMRRYRFSPQALLYVGDETRDIDACRKTGIPFLGVSWGFNDEATLHRAGASTIIHEPRELLSFL